MTVAAKKWLEKHFLFLILMQAKGALHWFHERDQDSLSSYQLETFFYCIFLPCIADVFLFKGSLYEGEMRQQQKFLLLWLHLGEYGKNSSHTFHDISEEKKGTFMVQRGYPSVLEDHERLPCRDMIFSHSSIMVDGFGIWNVKGRSHGALLQRPTMLSHRSSFLWMRYSKGRRYPFFLQIFMSIFSWEDLLEDLTFIPLTMYGRE